MFLKPYYTKLRDAWKAQRLKWCKTFFDRVPAASAVGLNPQSLASILFLRQDGKIGDYIVSSFAFREVKRANPDIKIGVVCSSKNRRLFDDNPYIDAVHEVKAKSAAAYWKLGKSLAGQYNVTIEPTLFLRDRDLVLLNALNSPYNVGLDKADYCLFNLNIANKRQHYADIYAEALKLLGFTQIDTAPVLPESAASAGGVRRFLQENALKGYIALNFFGASKTRTFDNAAIDKMLAALQEAFPRQQFVLLTCPEATPALTALCRARKNCFVYADTQTINDSIEILRFADAVVSPDTAIIHIAAALDKRIIGFYHENPQNFENWYPRSSKSDCLFFKETVNEISPQAVIGLMKQQCRCSFAAASPENGPQTDFGKQYEQT